MNTTFFTPCVCACVCACVCVCVCVCLCVCMKRAQTYPHSCCEVSKLLEVSVHPLDVGELGAHHGPLDVFSPPREASHLEAVSKEVPTQVLARRARRANHEHYLARPRRIRRGRVR